MQNIQKAGAKEETKKLMKEQNVWRKDKKKSTLIPKKARNYIKHDLRKNDFLFNKKDEINFPCLAT